jgi:hypothetical protein
MCGVMLFLAWPAVVARLSSSGVTLPSLPALAPAVVAPPRPQAAPVEYRAPVMPNAPALTLEQISATSTAIYHATAAAVDAPIPNTNTTGDTSPALIEERPAVREPAGANVPTAEPIAPDTSDGQTGSKTVLVNPQATHECRHGQVWTDGKGCKNP